VIVRYVSHEIRTPLNTVLMGLRLLRKDISDRGIFEVALSTITDIEISCDAAIQTLSGLLDYEKLESGIMKLDKKDILAWPVVRDAVGPFQVQVCGISDLLLLYVYLLQLSLS